MEPNMIFTGATITRHTIDKKFNNAIKRGLKNPEKYMYMHSTKKRDYFKNKDTRLYKSFNLKIKGESWLVNLLK